MKKSIAILIIAAALLPGCEKDHKPVNVIYEVTGTAICDGESEALDFQDCDHPDLPLDEAKAALTVSCEATLLDEGCEEANCDLTVTETAQKCNP